MGYYAIGRGKTGEVRIGWCVVRGVVGKEDLFDSCVTDLFSAWVELLSGVRFSSVNS